MKTLLYNFCLSTFLLLSVISCTDDFEDINTNPLGVSQEQSEADFSNLKAPFKNIFLNVYRYTPTWQTQLQHNLNADTFSGYMTPPRPFAGGANTTNYAFIDFWDQWAWDVPFSEKGVMQNYNDIKKLTEEKFPTILAIAQILRVETMHRVTDVYGPIVYSRYGDRSVSYAVYDSQEEVYNKFFEELDAAITQLDSDKNNGQLGNFDFAYSGDVSNWIRFANTLRLRLAMRIVNASPQKSKLEGEKSLNHPEGLLVSNSQNFVINGGATHPLTVFNSSWNDTRMNASMESFLVGFKDPRGVILFQNSEVTPGELKGIRSGMPLLSQYSDEINQKEDYTPFSKLGKMFDADESPTTSITLMTAAEAYFLRAEAALRDWSGAGDAQINYETGIQISFEQANAPNSTEYILDNISTPSNYTDPVNPEHNIDAQTSLTVAWNAGADQENKLEKIITQKWIAIFPDGQEAWSEFRRTGYPKIFPVVVNNSNGTIDTNIQVRRLPFPASQRTANPTGVEQAKTFLKGADHGGTRLWWDVEGSNF